MASEYLNLYMNNPTAGGTDGTAISLTVHSLVRSVYRLTPRQMRQRRSSWQLGLKRDTLQQAA